MECYRYPNNPEPTLLKKPNLSESWILFLEMPTYYAFVFTKDQKVK